MPEVFNIVPGMDLSIFKAKGICFTDIFIGYSTCFAICFVFKLYFLLSSLVFLDTHALVST